MKFSWCSVGGSWSVVFGTLGVVLEEQAEGGEAEQEGLEEPQAASGRAVDTFVTAERPRGDSEHESVSKSVTV